MKIRFSKFFIGIGFLSLLLTGCQTQFSSKDVVGYHIDENGHLIIEYNDGSTKDMGEYHGPDGNNNYIVNFLNYDSSVLYTTSVARGGTAVYQGETPTRPKSDNYIYTFNGWSESLENVVGNLTVVAQYEMKDRYYTVTFNNWDGTLLTTQKVEYGSSAYYYGTPTRQSTNTTNYTFTGWDVDITNVKSNITATAQFTESTRYYTVTFKNYDGTSLGTEQVEYDGTVIYTKPNPTRAPDVQYASYTFTGWDKSLDHITENCVRTATYEHGPLQQYIVQFVDGDNATILQELTVDYGSSVSYSGIKTPTKTATAQYNYTFNGTWSTAVGSLSFVNTNMVAKPNFSSTLNKYTVTFKDSEGNILDTDTVDYGSSATYSGAEPTKESDDPNKYYAFSGWDISLDNITWDTTATAQFVQHTKFKKIAIGNGHYLAIGTDGYLYSWGSNGSGQCGDGTKTNISSPKKIETLGNNVTDIFAGANHSAAIVGNLASGGKYYMWGSSNYGQCANNSYDTSYMVPTEVVAPSSKWSGKFALGSQHTLGLTSTSSTSSQLFGWGYASDGGLGSSITWVTNPTSYGSYSSTIANDFEVYASNALSAIKAGTKLYMSGSNGSGQCGDGTTTKVKEWKEVNVPNGISSAALGKSCSAAINTNNELYVWGNNSNGQFGNGSTSNLYIPTKVELSFDLSSIKFINTMMIAKSTSGDYYYAGQDSASAFSSNGYSSQTTFKKVIDGSKNIVQIEGNSSTTFGITSDYKLVKISKSEFIYF